MAKAKDETAEKKIAPMSTDEEDQDDKQEDVASKVPGEEDDEDDEPDERAGDEEEDDEDGDDDAAEPLKKGAGDDLGDEGEEQVAVMDGDAVLAQLCKSVEDACEGKMDEGMEMLKSALDELVEARFAELEERVLKGVYTKARRGVRAELEPLTEVIKGLGDVATLVKSLQGMESIAKGVDAQSDQDAKTTPALKSETVVDKEVLAKGLGADEALAKAVNPFALIATAQALQSQVGKPIDGLRDALYETNETGTAAPATIARLSKGIEAATPAG